MKSVRFHDSKLKFVKALLFRSFHETEAPIAFYHFLGDLKEKIFKTG